MAYLDIFTRAMVHSGPADTMTLQVAMKKLTDHLKKNSYLVNEEFWECRHN